MKGRSIEVSVFRVFITIGLSLLVSGGTFESISQRSHDDLIGKEVHVFGQGDGEVIAIETDKMDEIKYINVRIKWSKDNYIAKLNQVGILSDMKKAKALVGRPIYWIGKGNFWVDNGNEDKTYKPDRNERFFIYDTEWEDLGEYPDPIGPVSIRLKIKNNAGKFICDVKMNTLKTNQEPSRIFNNSWSMIDLKVKYAKFGNKFTPKIAEGKIIKGMTPEMVRASWGEPDDINQTVGSFGVHEQWVFGETYADYVYFENGKVVGWQD